MPLLVVRQMGREIRRVPPNFTHPTDKAGEPIPGAHCEILYGIDPTSCSAFQVYENVTEGTPVSPVFPSEELLVDWLLQQGHSQESARAFIARGFAPSLIVNTGGKAKRDV